jgi:cyclopropane fatty-acyl-phospholipid synthase-like methyltransferase
MNLVTPITRVLSLPAAYCLFSQLVAKDHWQRYLAEYVKPQPGEKVLDIGCGPGDVLNFLPAVKYTGFDISPQYIQAAQTRFGSRGRFWCGDVGLVALEQELGTFDLVLATGVLHHLDDERATALFALAKRALRPNGRLMTYDGCFVTDQSRLTRWVLRQDRGKFVRQRHEYERLAATSFSKLDSHVRHDLLRIPYTHLIMRCAN